MCTRTLRVIATFVGIAAPWATVRADEPPAATTRPAARQVEIAATIDGSDELHITPRGFRWVHRHWSRPSDIRINGNGWDPQGDAEWLPLEQSGTGLLAADLRAENVTVLKRSGRDTVAVEAYDDGIVVYFADGLSGADVYSVTLEFTAAATAATRPSEEAPSSTSHSTQPASRPAN